MKGLLLCHIEKGAFCLCRFSIFLYSLFSVVVVQIRLPQAASSQAYQIPRSRNLMKLVPTIAKGAFILLQTPAHPRSQRRAPSILAHSVATCTQSTRRRAICDGVSV